MLETLVSVVDFVKTTFVYGFYLSYKTGDILVNTINSIFNCFLALFDNLVIFLFVLYESLNIFLQDILQFFQQTFLVVSTSIETIFACVSTVFLKITLFISLLVALISSICNNISNGISVIITSIAEIFIFLKHLFVLFGSGVWFVITLVPLIPYYSCKLCLSIIYNIYKEICDICYSGILNIKGLIRDTCYFIVDVPLESLAGIIIASSLAYIFSQFYIIIISTLKQQLGKFRNWLRRQHLNIRETVSLHYPNRRDRPEIVPTPRPRQPVRRVVPDQQYIQARSSVRSPQNAQIKCDNSPGRDDKYCVICQERNKCILLLPCRHLCLCTECTRELRYYNEVCPICRTNIENTMKIFI